MAGQYNYGEQLANRVKVQKEQLNSGQNLARRKTRATPNTPPEFIPPTHAEVAALQEAIQSFEDRFQEWMRRQSRVLEDFSGEIEVLRVDVAASEALATAVSQLQAKMNRLEDYARATDFHELAMKITELKDIDPESAIEKMDERFDELAARIEQFEGSSSEIVQELGSLHAKVAQMYTILDSITNNDSAVGNDDQEPGTEKRPRDRRSDAGAESTSSAADEPSPTGLRIFFRALDLFGEELNSFSAFEDDKNEAEGDSSSRCGIV